MGKLRIVMYHYIRNFKNSRYPEIKGLDIALFRQQIDFLKENFHIITMEEVLGGGAERMHCRKMRFY